MMGSKLFHLVGVSRPNEPAAAALPRVRIAPALPDRKTLDGEIARLRDLDVGGLRSHWHNVFGRRPHPHLPRHLLFRVLAYRLQADVLGDLDGESQRLLDRSVSPEDAGQRAMELARRTAVRARLSLAPFSFSATSKASSMCSTSNVPGAPVIRLPNADHPIIQFAENQQ